MALRVPYRNAQILFENHTDLLNNQSEFDEICTSVNTFFENLKTRFDKGLFKENQYMFLRVAPSSELTIYVGISRKHNPYLFLYNAKTKQASAEIDYDLFKKIGKSPYIYVLEDAIKAINREKFNMFTNEDMNKEFDKLAKQFDDYDRD